MTLDLSTPCDLYDEFMRLEAPGESEDPRFVVRRIAEHEYEKVFTCVDQAFAKKRPRPLYDWLYRKNPYGRARVWAVEERSTGRILKTGSSFPWPVWNGATPLRGALSGDASTVPDWQRKGLSYIRKAVRRTHPWTGTICSFSGPNENSRAVSVKHGEEDEILGALKGGLFVLRGGALANRIGKAKPLVRAAGGTLGWIAGAWRRVNLTPSHNSHRRLEQLDSFTSEFNDVTCQTMFFEGYWCPHNADFLNWRYVNHPVEDYRAYALLEGNQLIAYSIVRFDNEVATLAEFAAEPGQDAIDLLSQVLNEVQSQGCGALNFFGTPGWRHWRLFHKAGALPYRSKNYLEAVYEPDQLNVQNIQNWQVTPGDRDYH